MTPPSLPPLTDAGSAGLAAIRKTPREAVLGFDFDGTLAPIVEDPTQARAHPGAVPALTRLAPLVDAIVIVTGRPAARAVEYGGLAGVNGLVVLGQYGLERWEDGRLTVPEPLPGVAEARAALPTVLAGAAVGTHMEDKGHALAVHTRRCAEPQAALDALRPALQSLAERTGLHVEPGRYVLELRPSGMDKGVALHGFLAGRSRPGFPSAVLYAGDDLGDLAAYAAVDQLRSEGIPGVKVCSGSTEVTALADQSDVVVDGPTGVVHLLEYLATALG